jgi:hypothetical protein
LHFPYGQGCWVFLHACIGHLYFFLWELCVHLPIYSMGCWFIESLVFWAPCIFWLLIPYHLYSWQILPLCSLSLHSAMLKLFSFM